MRHYAAVIPRNSIYTIDFLWYRDEKYVTIDDKFSRATSIICTTMGVSSFNEMNSGQQDAYMHFLDWFNAWKAAGETQPPHWHRSRIAPEQSSWIYSDLTTGNLQIFIGLFNIGYGETEGGPTDLISGY